ncbi:MAG: hypothetical protein WCX73_04470 [Candidatus Pacearchaeota archaeon]|jgi:hypothetical protein
MKKQIRKALLGMFLVLVGFMTQSHNFFCVLIVVIGACLIIDSTINIWKINRKNNINRNNNTNRLEIKKPKKPKK